MFRSRGNDIYRVTGRPTTTIARQGVSTFGIVVTLVLLLVAGLAIYFLYNLLFAAGSTKNLVTLVGGQIVAAPQTGALPSIPPPFEGGEYTISLWVYVNSFNTNTTNIKHIIDIGGNNFSTVLIGLGASKNSIIVRTHSSSSTSGSDGYGAGASYGTPPNTNGRTYLTPPPLQNGSLTTGDITTLLNTVSTSTDLDTVCDLNEFDFQRWTCVTVVLSGRSIDVYLDGKLSRSCITESYYKVDPSGAIATMFRTSTAGVGFDGYVSKVQVANVALNPSDIYTLYSSGP